MIYKLNSILINNGVNYPIGSYIKISDSEKARYPQDAFTAVENIDLSLVKVFGNYQEELKLDANKSESQVDIANRRKK
jgi:hypothetical protein